MREKRYPEFEGRSVSNSTIETYLRCGVRWRFELEDVDSCATVAMAVGTSVAHGAYLDNTTKIQTGRGLNRDEFVDAVCASYDEQEDYIIMPSPEGIDRAQGAAIAYHRDISPKIQTPKLAEETLGVELGLGVALVGTPDLLEIDNVRDTKTGRRWTPERANRTRQLTAYDFLFEGRYDRRPYRLAIDTVFEESPGRWRGETLWTYRTDAQRAAYVRTVAEAIKGMDAGYAQPAPEMAWWCSETWCPYHRECQYKPG